MHIFSISSKSEVGVSVFTAMYENSHCSEATLVLRHGSLTLVPVLLALTQWWYGGVLPCPLLRGAVTWEYPLVARPQPEAVDVSPVHLREISVLAFPSRRPRSYDLSFVPPSAFAYRSDSTSCRCWIWGAPTVIIHEGLPSTVPNTSLSANAGHCNVRKTRRLLFFVGPLQSDMYSNDHFGFSIFLYFIYQVNTLNQVLGKPKSAHRPISVMTAY